MWEKKKSKMSSIITQNIFTGQNQAFIRKGLTAFIILLVLSIPVDIYSQNGNEVDGSTDERLAAQYLREGRYEQAVALYEELFESNPTPVIYNNYLEALFGLENFRQAERVVRSQVQEHPGEVRYQVDAAWVNDLAGNNRRAGRQMDELIESLRANPGEVTDLAIAFEARGYLDRSLETYLQGRRLLEDRYPLHIRIAGVHEKKGNFRAMMNEYIDYMDKFEEETARVRGILQDAVANDPGFERNDALRSVLLERTQRNPDNIMYSEMLLWLSIQQQDFRMAFMQARALDRRLQQEGRPVLEVASLATSNRYYTIAANAYNYILDMGEESTFYMEALVGYLNVRFLSVVDDYTWEREELLDIKREYEQALDRMGVSSATVQLVRNLANLHAFYLDNTRQAIELLQGTLDLQNISNRVKGECRIELADILLLTGEVWDATLLYSQVDRMFRDDPLAHEAKFKNARLTYFIGEFDWARAQLDVLKAGTSRLIANDAMRLSLKIQDNLGVNGDPRPLKMYARAEQQIFMNRFEEAMEILDSVKTLYPEHQINDDLLYAKAEIKLKQGDFTAADSLLALIVERYPTGLIADEALFQRAGLHHNYFEDHDKAMALYQQIMTDYPGSLHTVTARNRFRTLRGDIVN